MPPFFEVDAESVSPGQTVSAQTPLAPARHPRYQLSTRGTPPGAATICGMSLGPRWIAWTERPGPLTSERAVRIEHRSLYPDSGGTTDLDTDAIRP